jgi:hypothetical protein
MLPGLRGTTGLGAFTLVADELLLIGELSISCDDEDEDAQEVDAEQLVDKEDELSNEAELLKLLLLFVTG